MKHFTLPPLRSADWLAVILEAYQDAGVTVWSVTTKGRSGSPRRRWFGEEAHAFAYALDQSETRRLALIDMRDGGES
ncbi:hypothetical protein GGQ88_003517 [Novosphingobium hassiacum]|uniref:Uncharacterized protein n=1 Tax=Novosphingobium hassiacum TaxID=173676 RepID=A0A7W6EXU3_9SPHN|nr:hypothetical protein [Novosphingobium hassiacum]MBB3862219.1 hypothetical protein [Novosphingobium hassiacum]